MIARNMPQFIIEQPGVPPQSHDITVREVSLGREKDNDIVLVADEVSRHHAKIKLQGDRTILYDLQSLNGTYVNRQRIQERVLSDKDEVWLGGKCRALFQDDSDAVKERRRRTETDSALSRDLKLIREEMENVSASMTMIGQRTDAAGSSTPVPKVSDADVLKMSRAFRRLDALYKASNVIASEFDLNTRMQKLLDLAIEVMRADRGFLMLREEGKEELGTMVARDMDQEVQSGSPSMGIARQAAIYGEPVLMSDSEDDSKFGGRESVIRQRILSAMCVPIRTKDRILGALYVDTKRLDIKFGQEDLELFHAFASQSAMAIENVGLHDRMVDQEKKRADLERFLSPSVVDLVIRGGRDIELGAHECLVSTMFCDIRSFTPIAERMKPDDLVAMLNEHFTAVTEIVFERGGTLDKFIGDEVMALFGAPIPAEMDALRAVEAAIAIRAKNEELNATRPQHGWPTLALGIGINTGEVRAGFLGSPKRMDFSVLGDHVNIASRLCSVAKPGQIVIGAPTFERVQEMIEAQSIGAPILKGKEVSVTAYEVLGLKNPAPVSQSSPVSA